MSSIKRNRLPLRHTHRAVDDDVVVPGASLQPLGRRLELQAINLHANADRALHLGAVLGECKGPVLKEIILFIRQILQRCMHCGVYEYNENTAMGTHTPSAARALRDWVRASPAASPPRSTLRRLSASDLRQRLASSALPACADNDTDMEHWNKAKMLLMPNSRFAQGSNRNASFCSAFDKNIRKHTPIGRQKGYGTEFKDGPGRGGAGVGRGSHLAITRTARERPCAFAPEATGLRERAMLVRVRLAIWI